MDRGAWQATVHGVAESDTTKATSLHFIHASVIFKPVLIGCLHSCKPLCVIWKCNITSVLGGIPAFKYWPDLSYVKYVYVTPAQRLHDPILANNSFPHFLFSTIGLVWSNYTVAILYFYNYIILRSIVLCLFGFFVCFSFLAMPQHVGS